jgi:hypothetical protein
MPVSMQETTKKVQDVESDMVNDILDRLENPKSP